MSNNTMVKIINKFNGTVGYTVPDLGVHRNFYSGESKEVSFDELEKLSFTPGGETILREYLEIIDEKIANEIFNTASEPEYHYSKEDILNLMKTGSLDQFLDCLDFAPETVKEMIKDLAVDLPLNDVEKRKAIQDKLGFSVDNAIAIKNTKTDGDSEVKEANVTKGARRAAPLKTEIKTAETPVIRRATPAATK